jgi:serine/threonine-protein kinase RsbW
LATLGPAYNMGKNTGGEAETVDQFLDSSLDSVDSAEQLVLDVARKAGFQEEDLHKIGMAVRESMVNAVVHGNQYSAHKKVRVSVSKGQDRLTVTISDQGKGFELEALPDPLSEENLLRNSGRGIFLIRAFMDELHVRRLSPAGTEVTLTKYLIRK